MKLLLNNKADVSACCTDGDSTALYVAAENDHIEVVELLPYKKADMYACPTDGSTPLVC